MKKPSWQEELLELSLKERFVLHPALLQFIQDLLDRQLGEIIESLDEIKIGEFEGMTSMPAVVIKLRNRILAKLKGEK